jgi:hypothetical protein
MVMVCELIADRVTPKTALDVPKLPSVTAALATVIVGVSSSVIVPAATPSPMVAPLAFARLTPKFSLTSGAVSLASCTTTCSTVCPGSKSRVPLAAV